jgi:hypothetical protein
MIHLTARRIYDVWGKHLTPITAGHCSSKHMNRHIPFSPHRDYRFYQGPFATGVANGIQALNFLGDRFLRKSHASAGIDELYRHSVNSAFAPNEAFLVTGAPHASAYYPRDFAWFYPDVLDPGTIMDSEDAVRRVRLLEKSVRLLLEAVRSNVVTTTIVPAGGDRYIGVNYFSQPSDTLLGILAGLEQIMRADQRASPFLAMAQGAHAGRLLLAEYRDDLKDAIFQLAGALQPFDDNGLTALLCDVTAPRSAATDTRAERRRFVTNACVSRNTRRSCSGCSASMAISGMPWIPAANRRRLALRSISSMCTRDFGIWARRANARYSQPRRI